MSAWLTFRGSLERKIVLLVLLVGVAPLALMAQLAMREIESQTLVLAEKQLRESTKTYALDLLNDLSHAASEMRIMHLGGRFPPGELTTRLTVSPAEDDFDRARLIALDQGIQISFREGESVLTGLIEFDGLLSSLGHLPFGIERCIEINGRTIRCAGSEVSGGLLTTRWDLPLSTLYDSVDSLTILTRQEVVTALSHVGLVSRLLPLVLLVVAAIVALLLVWLIRKRVAPLSLLESATGRISRGEYDARVDIGTGDELERLGGAFNLMSHRLGESFDRLDALSRIDRLILSGASVEDVIRDALILASDYAGGESIVLLVDASTNGGCLFRIEKGDLQAEKFDLPSRAEVMDRASLIEALTREAGMETAASFELRIDSKLAGLLVARSTDETDFWRDTLAELADRISVAATNTRRADVLYRQATYDGLTGLINRQAFLDRLGERVAAAIRNGKRGALLFLDLDRFKQVNDTRGHVAGDELLRGVAGRLRTEMRASDLIARLGGDEFAVIVPEFSSEAELVTLCRRLIRNINEPIRVGEIAHEIDVSIGICVFPTDGDDPIALLMKSDVAMYKAKEQSGSSFTFFDQSLNRATEMRVEIESRLRGAMASKQLCLHFQPKMDLRDGGIAEVEGLMRWIDRGDVVYQPSEFVPIAEETGLIHQFTSLLVEEASRCLETLRLNGLKLDKVAINISSRQFSKEGFARHFLQAVESAGALPTQFEIEVTESLFIEDADRVIADLHNLRSAGVRIALDDFGTGYSSLNILRSLPLDSLKIDRAFITPLLTSTRAQKIAQKIIEIAKALDLVVVAEGVESEAEINLLKDLGCHYVQGYFIARPMPLDTLETFLADHQGRSLSRPRLATRSYRH